MALPYFFLNEIKNNNTIILPAEISKHCVQVLRMKNGEQLQLTDGQGNLATSTIKNADKKNCLVEINEMSYAQKDSKKITIAMALLKNVNRFEWFLEKATETGVSEIKPLITKRTETRSFRLERMNNIIISAMIQSRQTWRPVLHEPALFKDIFAQPENMQKLIAHCETTEKVNLREIKIQQQVEILIGPEGDFTPEEINMALENGYKPVSLGKTRLRTETAGLVAISLLMNS